MLNKRCAILFAIIAFCLISMLVFIFQKTIDFPTLLIVLKLALPSAFVAYICGYYMESILKTAKIETNIISTETQKQFVDDLLIPPSEVLNENFYEEEKQIVSKNEELLEENKDVTE